MWPWVSQMRSIFTPDFGIASAMRLRSPQGSITTPRCGASHQIRVQFCSNGVTGTMVARAFGAWRTSARLVSVLSCMASQCRFFGSGQVSIVYGVCVYGIAVIPEIALMRNFRKPETTSDKHSREYRVHCGVVDPESLFDGA